MGPNVESRSKSVATKSRRHQGVKELQIFSSFSLCPGAFVANNGFSSKLIESYWQAIQQKVCAKCIDRDSLENSLLGEGDACALRTHLSQIVESVLSVQSAALDPYVAALRRHVCSECRNQSLDTNCSLRRSIDCGLDRYFPLVVETIEEVNYALHPITETV
jgi:hypothetical protein